jgi:hypothetical protein
MSSGLTGAELARELEPQPDTRKDDGAVETALEARRVPGDGRTRTVVLDRGHVSEYTLIPHAATSHPAHLLLRATPPSTPAMTLSTRAAPGLKKGTENPHALAGPLSRPPGGVIPGGHPPGRRPCGTRRPHVSPESQRRHPVWFSRLANYNPTGAQGVKARLAALISAKEKRPASHCQPSALKPFFLSLRAWTHTPSGLGLWARKPHKPDDSRSWESGESP